MKTKKGFTLIELLAVIVILAIIALIATPIIIGVIDDARKGAFENTAYGVLEGLRLNYVERTMDGTTSEEKNFTFPNSGLKLSGEEPGYGEAKVDASGNISFALADKDKRWCVKKDATSEKVTVEDYNEETCKINGTNGGGEATTEIADGTAVYFDPVAGTKCDTYTEANSATGVKTGCMKWYTFGGNNSSDKVNLLLDHNTTAVVAWNSSNINTEMNEVKIALETDTERWGGSPRLITAGEVAEITNNPNVQKFKDATAIKNDGFYFDTNTASYDPNKGPGTSKYAWLFDRTFYCTNSGCNIADNSNLGYWTSTAVNDSLIHVWSVGSSGCIMSSYPKKDGGNGLRPVITISKSIIS